MTRTIDITPTWKGLLPLFLTALEIGTDEGKRTAKEELTRMAEAADALNAVVNTAKEILKLDEWTDHWQDNHAGGANVRRKLEEIAAMGDD